MLKTLSEATQDAKEELDPRMSVHFIEEKATNEVIVVIANINWGISTDKVNFLKCLSFNGS